MLKLQVIIGSTRSGRHADVVVRWLGSVLQSQVMLEAEALPVRTQTLIPFIANAFDAEGKPNHRALDVGLAVMLEDLAWLGTALKTARAQGMPAPAALRIRAAKT